ncbi:cell death abnormality protein 1-like [Saccostrea echinata]|uniref:cell death abnormality protein 1-like n=1 Tax=Saccostrea echinata TaxID=191078 RepID=UPI002A82EBE6|nr:cell death abnormality protein 1-like [Saccostrea echinata]
MADIKNWENWGQGEICMTNLKTTQDIRNWENIALNKSAWQQFPFSTLRWGADKAVDGRFSKRSAEGGQCTISADKKRTATWWVDLGRIFNSTNGYTARFLGFSVYISNTTDKDEGTLCYKDTTYSRSTIPNVITIECVHHGQYVIYYNERRKKHRSGYSLHAFNELCEFEVYGCSISDVYGENCDLPCPQNCQDRHCNIVDGTCLGCITGYKGSRCNEKCDGRMYGQDCNQSCGLCFNSEQCHHINGTCFKGCDKGFYGEKCTEACLDGCFGYNYQETCSNCSVPQGCDTISGILIGKYSDSDTNSQCYHSLYGILSSLCSSVGLNIILIIRICRNKVAQGHGHHGKSTEQSSTEQTTPNIQIYDRIDDNEEYLYEELAQLNQTSHYDQLH